MFPSPRKSLRTSLTKRPAVSLVIALVMVLAFMNLSADIMQSMARTQNIAKGGMSADQAQLNAQLGLELGLYSQNKPKEFKTLINAIAANSNYKHDSKDGNNTLTDKDGNVVASWQISDSLETKPVCVQTEANGVACSDEFFVYPYPGSGSVGGTHCNIKTQPIQKNNQWLEDMYLIMKGEKYKDLVTPIDKSVFALEEVSKFDTLDHPCLWNTVVKGSSAEVPLFRIDSDGKEIGAGNIEEFYVRARLPCKNGSTCLEKDRWELATENGGKNIENTRALIWNIVTDCKTDTLCYLSEASEKYLTDTPNDKGGKYTSLYSPSQITYEMLKNGLDIFKKTILTYVDDENPLAGVDGTKNQNIGPIKDFLNNKKPWNDFQNSKPFFHLSIAAPLYVNPTSDQTVDTIEYQILYTQNKTIPPVITNPTVRARGSNGGYTVNVESSLSKQTGAFNFSLIGN